MGVMQLDYCSFCFHTIYANESDVLRCQACGSVYHEIHLDGECLNCDSTSISSFSAESNPPTKNLTRKPIRLKRHRFDPDEPKWGLREYLAWGNNILRATVNVLIGVAAATTLGAYAFRILSFNDFNEPLGYLNNILRTGLPSREITLVALVTSILGAFVFFPSELPSQEDEDSFGRRIGRFIAIGLILLAVNLLIFAMDANQITGMLTSEYRVSFGNTGLALLAAQGGAIVSVILIGTFIRRINEPIRHTKLPRRLDSLFEASNVLWFYLTYFFVAIFAIYVSIQILPERSLQDIPVRIAGFDFMTNYAQLAVLTIVGLASLLFYRPPSHSAATRSWWLIRVLGIGVTIIGFVIIYRGAPSSELDAIIQASIVALTVSLVSIPVQRGLS